MYYIMSVVVKSLDICLLVMCLQCRHLTLEHKAVLSQHILQTEKRLPYTNHTTPPMALSSGDGQQPPITTKPQFQCQ
uniref:Secreted protein n=1 Tax=Coturnix japonica TaxID=93934 RepID=A0A8C2YGJ5_COTJA